MAIERLVLDHQNQLVLSPTDVDRYFDEVESLHRLAEGLAWLYSHIVPIEAKVKAEAQRNNVLFMLLGKPYQQIPLGRLSAMFQWYAVSVCSYTDLVGYITLGQAEAHRYTSRVVPRILQYRNKVAAHMAITNPRRDNAADLKLSTMTGITYNRGRLVAAGMLPELDAPDGKVEVTAPFTWSLTAEHERLKPRFWPKPWPPASESMRLGDGETRAFRVPVWSDDETEVGV